MKRWLPAIVTLVLAGVLLVAWIVIAPHLGGRLRPLLTPEPIDWSTLTPGHVYGDVLFLGDSRVVCSVVPWEVQRKTGREAQLLWAPGRGMQLSRLLKAIEPAPSRDLIVYWSPAMTTDRLLRSANVPSSSWSSRFQYMDALGNRWLNDWLSRRIIRLNLAGPMNHRVIQSLRRPQDAGEVDAYSDAQVKRLLAVLTGWQNKGGRVFLVRPPLAAVEREYEEMLFPSVRLAEMCKEAGIGWLDFSSRNDYLLSDGLHMHTSEMLQFTRDLVIGVGKAERTSGEKPVQVSREKSEIPRNLQ